MPNIVDPSELRTDVTGKVVRYLQDNGGEVNAGEPFIEVEAMKMIMPLKASESGKITHTVSPGTVISAGDLLASLELKDPSKVKKISVFEGALDVVLDPGQESHHRAVVVVAVGVVAGVPGRRGGRGRGPLRLVWTHQRKPFALRW